MPDLPDGLQQGEAPHANRSAKNTCATVDVGAMNYIGYFDDSGHPDDQMTVVVAGFIATEDQWRLFERDWRNILDPFGIDIFHMTDVEASNRWSRIEKDLIVERLVRTITTRAQYHISEIVLMDDYKEI